MHQHYSKESLKGRERAIINQMNTGTVDWLSKAMLELGKLLRDGAEHIWAFLSA